jgi:hypothetical protein
LDSIAVSLLWLLFYDSASQSICPQGEKRTMIIVSLSGD